MASVLDIVRGISQAAANAYDGSQDEKYSLDGEARKIGLKREEGEAIIDSRVVDGFNVRMSGPILTISYQSDIKLKDVYAGDIEADCEQMIQNVANFLKKEYKKVTGNSLTLTPQGEAKILVQNTSKVRVFIVANKDYKIGNIGEVDPVKGDSKDSIDAKFKSFLEQGGLGTRPDNDKRKE